MTLKQAKQPKTVTTQRISNTTVRRIATLQAIDKMLEPIEEPEE